jgi:starch synthase
MIEVLSVASEAYPLIKTGGLADVTGALPGALSPLGVSMRTLLPGYPVMTEKLNGGGRVVAEFDDLFDGPAKLVAARINGLEILFIDAPHLYARPGNPYLGPDGVDWPDNWRRFAALSWVGFQLGHGLLDDYQPQVIQCHDWQAGLLPAYMKYGPPSAVRTVMTVHNIAFKGHFGSDIFPQLRLPPAAFDVGGVEFYGGIGYLKSGMECADFVTTVSPNYAEEIRTPAFGMGLEGLLNGRAETVVGILNGIDTNAWDPAIDPDLTQTYSANSLHLRQVNKQALAERFNLDGTDGPLFCVISRFTGQKGMDLLAEVIDGIVLHGARFCLLGSGEPHLEAGFAAAAARHPGKVGLVVGYDEALSHLMQGGADAILVPSRFEPCGLTQLYGLRYGCVPVVSRVGGLADTIIDANPAALDAGVATGIQFDANDSHALYEAARRAIRLYGDEKQWRKMQRRGMKSDVSWEHSANRYAELYSQLLGLTRDHDSTAD